MKKLFLAILLFGLFGFIPSISAYNECVDYRGTYGGTPCVPCTHNGYDYYQMSYADRGQYREVVYFNCFDLTSYQSYNSSFYEFWTNPPSMQAYSIAYYDNGQYLLGRNTPVNTEARNEFVNKNAIQTTFLPGDICSSTVQMITFDVDPLDGGEVEIGGFPCTTCPCTYPISNVDQLSVEAIADEDYAFGYWISKDNPHPLSLDSLNVTGDKIITAKFFKTFRNAVTGGFTYPINYVAGECVVYVRSETGIPYAAFHGNAMDCFGLANAAGYATGNTPKVGAIAVFSRDALPSSGHVGIVKEILSGTSILLRHSNFSTVNTVSEETINLTNTPVLGYIYPTP